ncbi:YegP family protein [Luteimonas sp. TWI1437]|uniref:YegP family protein n=1 Tax=unclassified Luteimonas TaxID=2629088 RepID=UPI003207C633
MAGRYVLSRSGDQYHFVLKASNGEPILSSERYTTKANALGGITSVRNNSPIDARYEKRTAANGQFYFVLKASNGEPIGTSETYTSSAGRDAGIASVKAHGPDATLTDNT